MGFTAFLRDIETLYRIKCSKYRPEELDDQMKNILLDEAITETKAAYAIDNIYQERMMGRGMDTHRHDIAITQQNL